MTIDELKNKKILIIGYGIEGKATEAYLKKHLPGATIDIADNSQGKDYLSKQKNYDIAVKSPGVPAKLVTIPFTTATNIFFAQVKGTTIGVTGTKGKSTTTSLIYHILKNAGKSVCLVGNIGKPMLDLLVTNNSADDIFVIELSSYQLEDIKYAPHISLIVSLYPDHLDRYDSLEQYYEAKHQMIQAAKPHDVFIYNPVFPRLMNWAKKAICRTKPYDDELPLPIEDIPLLGEHNLQNIQGAVTVAREMDVSEEVIADAIRTFKPLRHRLQNVGTYKGITFYDDAISTTPESTIKGIEALKTVKTIFLGGLDRGYDFSELIKVIEQQGITSIVLFPDSGHKILGMLKDSELKHLDLLETSSMKEAVEFAYKHTPAGAICLLSTASPSYSVWKNFEEKGDQFQHWVHEYGKEDHEKTTSRAAQTG